ncbi:hypothetical protein [Nocardia farcinica]|uniref:hypothetical protein n=1 Tax=Nocardia farcinica TaxID=37329 RepID=UPI001892EC2C|nr:hypothetical protein [Nocardia farcinica]MBF6445418.1 hypothetical protein [Nocardia farcinica]
MGEGVEHSTLVGGQSARWVARDGVVRVRAIVDQTGRVTTLDDMPLGECFGLMERGLWERVRLQFETQRDPRFAQVLAETRERLRRARR